MMFLAGSTRLGPGHWELVPCEDGGGAATATRQPCLGGGWVPALHLRGLGCLDWIGYDWGDFPWDLTKNGDLTMKNGDLTIENGDLTIKNGDLTIKNGDLTMKNGDFTMKNGDLTMKNGDFTMKNGDLTMKNGDFTMKNGDLTMKNVDFTMKNGDLTMKNGDFTMKNGDLTMKNGGLTMKNCDFPWDFIQRIGLLGKILTGNHRFSHEDHGAFLQIFPQTNPWMGGCWGGVLRVVLRVFLGKVDMWLFLLGCEAQIWVEFLADFGGKQKFGRVLDWKKDVSERKTWCVHMFLPLNIEIGWNSWLVFQPFFMEERTKDGGKRLNDLYVLDTTDNVCGGSIRWREWM